MRAGVPQEGIEAQRLCLGYSPAVQDLASDAILKLSFALYHEYPCPVFGHHLG